MSLRAFTCINANAVFACMFSRGVYLKRKTHLRAKIAKLKCTLGSETFGMYYTYCSIDTYSISDLKPLTGTSADQLPHRKSRPLATA